MFPATSHSGGLRDSATWTGPKKSKNKGERNPGTMDAQTLRYERWVAIGVLILFSAVIAGLLFLASLSGTTFEYGDPNYQYWMMP